MKKQDEVTVDLTGVEPFAAGSSRVVFEHPDDPNRCIKVDHTPLERDFNLEEATFIERMQRIRGKAQFDCLSPYYGRIQTSLGAGTVHGLMRNETDGEIAFNLREAYDAGDELYNRSALEDAFQEFRKNILAECIIARDVNSGNLVAKAMRDGSFKIVLVDGVGHKYFILRALLFDHVPWFTRMKIRQMFQRRNLYHFESFILSSTGVPNVRADAEKFRDIHN